ncbi:hypothetical protein THOD04_60358 [Vibrio owensii]|nr:hypothetical protein THOD04_60358 [Vibrio owensii]
MVDTLLTMFLYVECIQSWVIPASLDETRNLLTTRWEMAITSGLNSIRWVDPESCSFLAVQDDGR